MDSLRVHHYAVTLTCLMALATAVTYTHAMYPYAVWNAFLTGVAAVMTVWSFALEHGLRMPTPDQDQDHLD